MSKKIEVEIFGERIEAESISGGFQLDYTQEFDAPTLNFAKLQALSEHFGTVSIDVDNISQRGCQSCDYGSRYGYEIQVYGATRNIPNFESIESTTR